MLLQSCKNNPKTDVYIFFLLFPRRQIERSKLAREKQLRENAEREKSMLEQKLMEYQEEIRLAKESLVI